MNIIKKGIVMMLAVCMLAGIPAVNAWAADCNHVNKGEYTIDTGQYTYNYYTHSVIVGYYTNGNPIIMECSVSTQDKIILVHCYACKGFKYSYPENVWTSHTIVHQ